MATRARFEFVVLAALALMAACENAPIEQLLAGKSCTPAGACAAGYVCEASSQLCVADGSAMGGGGATSTSGGGGQGQGGEGGSGGFVCGEDPEPAGGRCPDVCTGGCDDGPCLIDCEGNNACDDAVIECPEGFDCVVLCNGNNACQNAVVNCSSQQLCQLTCVTGCSGLDLECGAGSCELTCGDGEACSGVNVHCGIDACRATCESTTEPMLECGDSCECSPCN